MGRARMSLIAGQRKGLGIDFSSGRRTELDTFRREHTKRIVDLVEAARVELE